MDVDAFASGAQLVQGSPQTTNQHTLKAPNGAHAQRNMAIQAA